MSKETLSTLNTQTLIGFTSKRGNAWHFKASEQGGESNHYPLGVPVEDVTRRLFNWDATEGTITASFLNEDGVTTTIDPERKAIMRSDNGLILGIFKNGYTIHQYQEWLSDNVATILDAELQIGSAGLLKGGAQAWVQIEMPETMSAPVKGGEDILFRPFLTAATSHDGSLATTYMQGAQVVVCDNTLSVALRAASDKIKIRHSTNSLGKINDVREALGIVYETADTFMAQVADLSSKVVSDSQWNEFVKMYTFPGSAPSNRSKTMAENKAASLNQLWNHDERVAPWKGSQYGVVAAVNTFAHHVQNVRGNGRIERNQGLAITGGFDKLDAHTLDLLAKVH